MIRFALLTGLLAWCTGAGAEDLPPLGSPFTPGVQNDSGSNQYRMVPSTPGVQNNSSSWNTGGGWDLGGGNWNSGGSNWNSGGGSWNNGSGNWQRVQPNYNQYQYQQPQRYGYTQPQYQSPSYPSQPQYTPSAPPVNYSGQPIHISMPADQYGSCAYVLASGPDSWNYTMLPGKSQKFTEDRSWQITFDRGGGYGEQSYRLIPGYYRFKQSSRGWELYHSTTAPPPSSGSAPPPPQ